MSQRCSVCIHPDAVLINEALVVEKRSRRTVANHYGLSDAAIQRHKEHIPKLLAEATRAQEAADADTLLDRLEGWTKRIEAAIEAVEQSEDYDKFFKGVAVLRPYLETIGEITKELERRPQVNIALVEHPDYQRLEDAIVRALESYPAARFAVAEAIKEIEAA